MRGKKNKLMNGSQGGGDVTGMPVNRVVKADTTEQDT